VWWKSGMGPGPWAALDGFFEAPLADLPIITSFFDSFVILVVECPGYWKRFSFL
jgi:hypothetical protein